jgi:hypothetical protein
MTYDKATSERIAAGIKSAANMRREITMFGCTTNELKQMVADSITARALGPHDGPLMIAMSLLSDAQELLAMRPTDDGIRQRMNAAKYLISTVMTRR